MVVVRATDVLWRVTGDRVLVRRVAPAGESDASDLLGAAALVWAAADRPMTVADVVVETGLDNDAVQDAITELLDTGWIVRR